MLYVIHALDYMKTITIISFDLPSMVSLLYSGVRSMLYAKRRVISATFVKYVVFHIELQLAVGDFVMICKLSYITNHM